MSGRLARLFDVDEAEAPRVALAAAAAFCVLGAWFVVRPLRDAMGTLGRAGELEKLLLVTPALMLALTPLLFFAASRLPRNRFVALAYRAFALSLLAFAPALARPHAAIAPGAARAFFLWTSVLNFFALSIFWGTMADRFTHRQGLRSFGVIGAGGTVGALAGSLVTAGAVQRFGPLPLLVLSAGLFEVALRLLRRIAPAPAAAPNAAADPSAAANSSAAADPSAATAANRSAAAADPSAAVAAADRSAAANPSAATAADRSAAANPSAAAVADPSAAAAAHGGASRGALARVVASPYLLGIAGYVLCWALTSTFVYLEQAALARAALPDPNARAALFAKIEAAVQASSLVLQAFATGRLLRALGAGRALALLPALSFVGFAALGAAPRLGLLVAFQLARRTLDFGIAKPARELLFTVVDRDDKYKTKSVIDTVVYRGGDALGSVVAGSAAPALGASPALLALPLCAAWFGLALYLGAASERRARAAAPAPADPAPPPLAEEATAGPH